MARRRVAQGALAGLLAAPVAAGGRDRIGLDIGGRLRAVEHVVGRYVDQRDCGRIAGLAQPAGADFVALPGRLDFRFGEIDLGVGRGIHDQRRFMPRDRIAHRRRIRDVGFGTRERDERHVARVACSPHFPAELAVGAEQQDHATTPSRSPR